jgi:sugar phosphate isomerase/epimerase
MATFTRRSFLGTLSGATVLLDTALASRAEAATTTDTMIAETTADNMHIKFFCPRWGANDAWEPFCKRVKEAGYDGVEVAVQFLDAAQRQEMTLALKKYQLDFIIQALPPWSDAAEHRQKFGGLLRELAALRPLFINSQTGKDFFTFEQNKQILAVADKVAEETGVKIVHETHRGKFSYAAAAVQQFLEKIPQLRLTLDISHWCNVSESLLENQKTAVELAISRTDHFHARVGHAEGPQVNDPRAPEWAQALEAHLGWWDQVVSRHRQKGSPVLTVTPEFGPPTYMPTLPYTKQAVADQWELNVHMMQLLKQRYQA